MFTKFRTYLSGKRIIEKDGKFTPQVYYDGGWCAVPRERCYTYSNGSENPYGLIPAGTVEEPKNLGDIRDKATVDSIEQAGESYTRYLDYLEARKPKPTIIHKMPEPDPKAWRLLKEK